MAFIENLRTLNSILSSDLLIASRYDIMFNLSAINTYSTTGTAGVIQLAPSVEISEGDGFGAITPVYLSGASLQYPLDYNTSYVTVPMLSADPSNLASVEYVEAAISASAFNEASLEGVYLKRNATSTPTQNNTFNLGSSSYKWANIYATNFQGTATTALYADLAEKYKCAEEVEIGDVISMYDGDENYDVQKSQGLNDYKVIGVVSESPAFLMSKETDGPCVGLVGKLPVKVVGTCKKGDALVPSEIKGVAKALGASPISLVRILGYALEKKDSEDITLVNAIIK